LEKVVRTGIVGCGFVANTFHLPAFSKLKAVRIVSVCDNNEDRARMTARRYRVNSYHASLTEMLQKEELDVVDICTPPDTHARLATEALREGCNCMIEKPLTNDPLEAARLVAEARHRGLEVHGLYNYSFLPATRRAKNLAESGTIGRVVAVDVKLVTPVEPRHRVRSHWIWDMPGGLLGELTPHLAMLALDYVEDIKQVQAVTANMSGNPAVVADELRATVVGRNSVATLSLSYNSPVRRMFVDVIGTSGVLHVDGNSQAVVHCKSLPDSRAVLVRGMRSAEELGQALVALLATSVKVMLGRYSPLIEGHRFLIQKSIGALLGKTTYPIPAEKCVEAVRLTSDILRGVV